MPGTDGEEPSRILATLWQFTGGVKGVPFPTPSSLMRSDLQTLSQSPYLVTFKSDGVRAVLLLFFEEKTEKNRALFVYRNGTTREISNLASADDALYNGTALDGEVVGDEFIVFDAVAVRGYSVSSLPLRQRLIAVTEARPSMIFSPLRAAKTPTTNSSTIAISILTVKEFWDGVDSEHVFKAFEGKRRDGGSRADGVILAPASLPVGVGRLIRYYKYKPKGQITLDLSWTKESRLLRCGPPGFELVEDAIRNTTFDEKEFSALSSGVYECGIRSLAESTDADSASSFRLFLKTRRFDKSTANSKFVVLRTVQNVIEDISLSEVYNALVSKKG
jgi:hypothetical protein